jgi:hypothetical protein
MGPSQKAVLVEAWRLSLEPSGQVSEQDAAEQLDMVWSVFWILSYKYDDEARDYSLKLVCTF